MIALALWLGVKMLIFLHFAASSAALEQTLVYSGSAPWCIVMVEDNDNVVSSLDPQDVCLASDRLE